MTNKKIPADLMLRIYESVIYPGNAFTSQEVRERVCALYVRMIYPIYILILGWV